MTRVEHREQIARGAIHTYGSQRKKPYRIQPETWERIMFMGWLHKFFPEVWAVTFSTGNDLQGKRSPKTVNVWKSAGLKNGVPDLIILWPSRFYHGALIEMKRKHGGRASEEQLEMCERFRHQNYFVAIAHGFPNAAKALLRYLYDYN